MLLESKKESDSTDSYNTVVVYTDKLPPIF